MTKLQKLLQTNREEHGKYGDVVCFGEAYCSCQPENPHLWEAKAIRIVDHIAEVGRIYWDHGDFVAEHGEPDDADMYPWGEVSDDDFTVEETFDLRDIDDLAKITKKLRKGFEFMRDDDK